MKTRKDHVSNIQVAFPAILRREGHPSQDLNDDAGRNTNTNAIVEKNILLGTLEAVGRPISFLHGM